MQESVKCCPTRPMMSTGWLCSLVSSPSALWVVMGASRSIWSALGARTPKEEISPTWSGYRKAHGVQVKTYLGQDLSTQKLEQASAALWTRLKEKLGLLEEDPFLTTRFLSEKRREQESVRHLLDQLQKKDQVIADLRQELTIRDQGVADLERELAMRDQTMADLKQELTKRDQMIARLRDHSGSQGKRRKPHAKRS